MRASGYQPIKYFVHGFHGKSSTLAFSSSYRSWNRCKLSSAWSIAKRSIWVNSFWMFMYELRSIFVQSGDIEVTQFNDASTSSFFPRKFETAQNPGCTTFNVELPSVIRGKGFNFPFRGFSEFFCQYLSRGMSLLLPPLFEPSLIPTLNKRKIQDIVYAFLNCYFTLLYNLLCVVEPKQFFFFIMTLFSWVT